MARLGLQRVNAPRSRQKVYERSSMRSNQMVNHESTYTSFPLGREFSELAEYQEHL
jgi:hypothetical protein